MQIYKIKLNDNIEYFYSYDILSLEEIVKIFNNLNIVILDIILDNEMFVQDSGDYQNILIVDAKYQILSVDHTGYCSGKEGYKEDEVLMEEKTGIIIIEKDILERKYDGCTSGGSGYCNGFYTKYKIIEYKDLTTELTNELSEKVYLYCQNKWHVIKKEKPIITKEMYEKAKTIINKRTKETCNCMEDVLEYTNAKRIVKKYESV